MTKRENTTASFLAATSKKDAGEGYELCLFIAGTTPLSVTAVANVVAICEERLHGRYDLMVIDVYQNPARAKEDQIIAIPTLIKRRPGQRRRLIGDLSNRALVLTGLELTADEP